MSITLNSRGSVTSTGSPQPQHIAPGATIAITFDLPSYHWIPAYIQIGNVSIASPGFNPTAQLTVPGAGTLIGRTYLAPGYQSTTFGSDPDPVFSAAIISALTPASGGSITVTATFSSYIPQPGLDTSYIQLVGSVPAPIASLLASPATISAGNSSTLSWSSTDAVSATIDNGVGAVTPNVSGTSIVSPSVTTTYTLAVVGTYGATATRAVTVTVTAPSSSQSSSSVSSLSSVSSQSSSTVSSSTISSPSSLSLSSSLSSNSSTSFGVSSSSSSLSSASSSQSMTSLISSSGVSASSSGSTGNYVPVNSYSVNFRGWEVGQRTNEFLADYRYTETPTLIWRDEVKTTEVRTRQQLLRYEYGDAGIPSWLKSTKSFDVVNGLVPYPDMSILRTLTDLFRAKVFSLPIEQAMSCSGPGFDLETGKQSLRFRKAFFMSAAATTTDPSGFNYSPGDNVTSILFATSGTTIIREAASYWDFSTAFDPVYLSLDTGEGYLFRNLDPVSQFIPNTATPVSPIRTDDPVAFVWAGSPSLSDTTYMPPAMAERLEAPGLDISGGVLSAGGSPSASFLSPGLSLTYPVSQFTTS